MAPLNGPQVLELDRRATSVIYRARTLRILRPHLPRKLSSNSTITNCVAEWGEMRVRQLPWPDIRVVNGFESKPKCGRVAQMRANSLPRAHVDGNRCEGTC